MKDEPPEPASGLRPANSGFRCSIFSFLLLLPQFFFFQFTSFLFSKKSDLSS